MSTARRTTSARRRTALNLGRLLALSSMVSVVVLTQSGAASATSTTNFAPGVDYETGNRPVSVVVGDFNGDGDPDVAAAGSTVSVNLGGPGGSFGPATHYEGGFELRSIAIGDFDVDGNPDLVVADEYGDTVSVLLGRPDGTFGDPTYYPVDVTPTAVAVGDFNGDDDPDLAVTSGVNDTMSILLGGPGGTFGPKTSFQAGFSSPLSVTVGDFNDDSDPDLAVGDSAGKVFVLLGGPAATFSPATVYSIGEAQEFNSMRIALGDFNGDSDPDMAVVETGRAVWTLLGASGGTFTTPLGYVVPHATDVTVGDFNDDSRPDLAISESVGQLDVLHGRGDGTFVNLTQFPTRGGSTAVAAEDFDADGRTDVVLTNEQSPGRRSGISVLLNPQDITPPNTTITGGPTGPINQAPTFTFTSSEPGSTFACRVDDAAFSACSSPRSPAGLADGLHTFDVRATDAAGNVDPTPASRTFTVDTVAPDTTITGGPDGATNDNTPTFTFVSSEPGSTFECGFNGAFSDCTSPYTSDGIGDGEHTFEVRAKDAAGNEDASTASRTFTLDRNPPTTSITSGPSGVTGDSTPTFGFTSPEPGARYECRVDDAAFDACTTPHTTAELSDGDHVFQARSVDVVGNVDPIPAAIAFTVDTVAPDTEISSGPGGLIYDRTPSFSFSNTDGALTHECRVDDEPFTTCTSPTTTDPLSDGEHTFEVRGIDGGGNVDPTPAKRTFTIDTEIFRTGITAGPSGLTADSTPTFAFATPDPNSTFECRIAPAPFEECTSPYTAPEQSDGEHTLEVRATDSYGNIERSPAKRTFTVDTVAPDTTLDSGPTGTINDRTPSFGFSSADTGATLECRVDGTAFGPCASPYTTAPLGNGSHTFQARATDAAGNTDATPASRTFTVDADDTAPKTRIDSGPANITNQTSATFTFSADEPATFECSLDAGAYSACHSGDTFGSLDSGTHTFAVRATDLAGNVDPTPATRSWIVDTTPPQTTITGGPSALSLSSIARFAFTSSEGSSSFQCRLDGGTWQACTSPRTYTGVHLGNHTFSVRAIDPAGNTDPTPAVVTWLALGLLPF
ncbi:FG-GAP-like repeat-containing protein [Aeromicrobium ginsengisoli]|uniref:VCBS repeat-containing protein n=1 Tax=Aeromicrobium ginsengisoli TaxID=363867 RepID=A0A5M4FCS0_9ACTN|nr:FG-GAP-like repeat-containing protein [Aeromicrobium ginsengisoli]KAA1395692.1 VCBS repeat-containing protein [Aeromicrobium ginsengisoli]